MQNKLIKISICLVVLVGLLFVAMELRRDFFEDQAQFNVDVLEHYIDIYHVEFGYYPESLKDTVDFKAISYREGLALDLRDILGGTWRGYRYDYTRIGPQKYVLSASPVGFLPAKLEIGMTEAEILRVNDYNVDRQADSYEEVSKWDIVKRSKTIHSRYK